ncbi:NAD(P)-dependent oxidoreductase [Brucella pituitosa]|uniref:NAD(P)-dependent oxidoreductase n=1 Tax=Brucella pituitosa TaxID=571256 RepID=UPI003F4ABF4A
MPPIRMPRKCYFKTLTITGRITERVKPGMLFVDCSTVSVQLTREIAKAVSSAGGEYLDAPVSGGQLGAKEGTLTFMIGGEKPAFDRVRPMLEAMGKTYVHMGDHGTGQAAKCRQAMFIRPVFR